MTTHEAKAAWEAAEETWRHTVEAAAAARAELDKGEA